MGKRDNSGCAISRVTARKSRYLLAASSATAFLPANLFLQPVDDVGAGYALGLRLEVGQDTMREDRMRHGFQVLHAHEVTAVQHGMGLGAANQILHRARPG